MPTFLQLKNATANQLGKSDGGTANTIRDNHINDVVRNEIANVFPFSWLRKTNSSISINSSGQADLPSDYNPNHKIYDLRRVVSGTYSDDLYTEVPQEAFDTYGAGSLRYFIDFNTGTNLYRLNSTEPSVTLKVTYYHTPAAMTADADVCVVPDQDAVAYLAAARYWLSSERDETNHDRFKALGNQRLQQLVLDDKKARPQRLRRGVGLGINLGWNV